MPGTCIALYATLTGGVGAEDVDDVVPLIFDDAEVSDVLLACMSDKVVEERTTVCTDETKLIVDIAGGATEASVHGAFVGTGIHAELDCWSDVVPVLVATGT